MVHDGEEGLGGQLAPLIRVTPESSADVSAVEDQAGVRFGAGNIMNAGFANAPARAVFCVHESLCERFELWLTHPTLASYIARLTVSELRATLSRQNCLQ